DPPAAPPGAGTRAPRDGHHRTAERRVAEPAPSGRTTPGPFALGRVPGPDPGPWFGPGPRPRPAPPLRRPGPRLRPGRQAPARPARRGRRVGPARPADAGPGGLDQARLPRPRPVPPAPAGAARAAVRDLQVPHHAGRRRGPARRAGREE